MNAIKILKNGDQIPNVQFYIKDGANFETFNSLENFKDKRILIVGAPGAFWSDYPSSMIPGYDYHFNKFVELGIQDIFVTTTNDGYVLNNWFRSLGIKNLKGLPDGNAEWAKSIGFCVDMTNEGFGHRSHRYVMILENCLIKKIFYEDFTHDPHTCFTETNPESILDFLEKNQNTWYQFSKTKENHGRV